MEGGVGEWMNDGWMMDRWVDGWTDGWMSGWMGGWMDGWVGGWIDGWMDAQVGRPSQLCPLENQTTHRGKVAPLTRGQ
jgi:hypothetical protein